MTRPPTDPPPNALPREASQWLQVHEARTALKHGAGAAQLLGGIFIVLAVVLIAAVFGGGLSGGLQALAVANAVILVGPGVWYILAAGLFEKLDRRAVTITLWVALAQGVAVAAGLVLAAVLDIRNPRFGIAAPALLAMFFMPALAALAYHLFRLRGAMNLLGGGETGFEALTPRPVIPMVIPISPEESSPPGGQPQ